MAGIKNYFLPNNLYYNPEISCLNLGDRNWSLDGSRNHLPKIAAHMLEGMTDISLDFYHFFRHAYSNQSIL